MHIVLYVVPNCPLCEEMRGWLSARGVTFTERDVQNDYSALRQMYRLTRQGLVPVVETGGAALVRPNEEALDRLLQQTTG